MASELRKMLVKANSVILTEALKHANIRNLATRLVSESYRGYDCLPDGWIAVRAEPFDALRLALLGKP